MERTEIFDAAGVTRLRIRLHWASAVVVCSNVEQFELEITGTGCDSAIGKLAVRAENGQLSVIQPFSLPHAVGKHPEMKVRVFIPTDWKGEISVRTHSGHLEAMGLRGTDIALRTGSGSMNVASVEAICLQARTFSGDASIADVSCEKLRLHTLSGHAKVQNCDFLTANIASANGNCAIHHTGMFDSIRAATASGDITLTVPFDAVNAAFIAHGGGRLRTTGVNLTDNAPEVRMSTLSGNLILMN